MSFLDVQLAGTAHNELPNNVPFDDSHTVGATIKQNLRFTVCTIKFLDICHTLYLCHVRFITGHGDLRSELGLLWFRLGLWRRPC